ncbi:MarR family transcriptional regulator, partial [Actinomadura adrarensis]
MTTPHSTISADSMLWREMMRVHVQIQRRVEADMAAHHNLALASFHVLVQLDDSPGGRLRMNDLADRVLLSRSGLTRLIDR